MVEDARFATQWFPDFVELISNGLRACERLGRPARTAFFLRRARMFHALQYLEPGMREQFLCFSAELYDISGLAEWAAHPEITDPQARLTFALTRAVERHEALPEAQRACSPEAAIRELASFLAALAGYGCSTFDLDLLECLPSMAPYTVLSPGIELMQAIVSVLRDLRASRHDRYIAGVMAVLARLEQPDGAGLAPEPHRHARLALLYGVALTRAAFADPRALRDAGELDQVSSMRVAAWRVRQIFHLHCGDVGQAEACREQVEVLLIQQASRQSHAGTTLETEFMCYARMDDLVNLRRLLPELRAMASDHPGWQPLYLLAQAELERIRGRPETALVLLERVLEVAKPGRHMMWSYAAGAVVRSLVDLGRVEEARRVGLAAAAECERYDMGALSLNVDIPLALADAASGEHDLAAARVDRLVAHIEGEGMRGMYAGLAYEARARVALLARDQASYARAFERCQALFGDADDSPFTLNLLRLRAAALDAGVEADEGARSRAAAMLARAAAQRLGRELAECTDIRERAERALALVVEMTGAAAGHLYGMEDGRAVLLSSAGGQVADSVLEKSVGLLIADIDEEKDEHTVVVGDDAALDTCSAVEHPKTGYQLFPLFSRRTRERVAGVIALSFADRAPTEVTHEALAAIASELSHHSELTLFTITN
jgi:hypothetical protein